MSPPGRNATALAEIVDDVYSQPMLLDMPRGTSFTHLFRHCPPGVSFLLSTRVVSGRTALSSYAYVAAGEADGDFPAVLGERLRELRALHLLGLFVQFPFWWCNESVLGEVVLP